MDTNPVFQSLAGELILWSPSDRSLRRFDNELPINPALSINCNVYIFFVTSSPILSTPVTSFPMGTVKVRYFPVFSPKQINCFLNSSGTLL